MKRMKRVGRFIGYTVALFMVGGVLFTHFSNPALTETQLFLVTWPFELSGLVACLLVLALTEDSVGHSL